MKLLQRINSSGAQAESIAIRIQFNSVNDRPIILENDMGGTDGIVGRIILGDSTLFI